MKLITIIAVITEDHLRLFSPFFPIFIYPKVVIIITKAAASVTPLIIIVPVAITASPHYAWDY